MSFEYRQKESETPFETFLKYTNEKEESSKKLASILEKYVKDGTSLLDIGAGNGEYLQLTLQKLVDVSAMQLTLVEPSADLAKNLPTLFTRNTTISVTTFDDFITKETFDIILASHLFYHISRAARPQVLSKIISMVKSGGVLIVVLREKDDIYEFKTEFMPQLFTKDFKALVLDDILNVLPNEAVLSIWRDVAHSESRIPYQENVDDTISIIEFFLNKQWSEMPKQIQQASLKFVKAKKGRFKQIDGIAVIQKPDVV